MDLTKRPLLAVSKRKVDNCPILQYPKRDREYQMETDASDASIRGVLRIKNTNVNFLPVAYKLHKIKDSKCLWGSCPSVPKACPGS
ncbi:hypothetical protein DSO57_1029230 [Entomophthora muscae]|uniref:Uncharacterized protein n=1 Tax=Entomophthora muscae TaxID=34485 RepID=A0ACC2UM73_9FUNG|nr:hypothetical protein DSO57_1029230 [Entomophthora muscae]